MVSKFKSGGGPPQSKEPDSSGFFFDYDSDYDGDGDGKKTPQPVGLR